MSATPQGPGPDEIRDYLLRRLSDTARTRFEEAYFADDGLFERIESEEDRLVSDYVLGHLSQSDRVRFEESLLRTPYYQERVDTTNRIHNKLARSPGAVPTRAQRPVPQRKPAHAGGKAAELTLFPPGTGKAVAIVVLGILLVAALLSAIQLKRDVEALKAERGGGGKSSSAASTVLAPAAETVVIPTPTEAGPSVRRVRIALGAPILLVLPRTALAEGATTARLWLIDRTGERVWDSGNIELTGSAAVGDLALRLPAGLPPRGFSALVVATGTSTSFVAVLETVDLPPPA